MKRFFWILSVLLLLIPAIITYKFFHTETSFRWFIGIEALIVLTTIYLIVFYRRIIKPLQIIGDGMGLLKEQDFTSRISKVGQPEADRIVDIFNKMMQQLKEERLHLREQNRFLDLLINASPLGVIILDLDKYVASVNPAVLKLLKIKNQEKIIGKTLNKTDYLLLQELAKIKNSTSEIIRLNDANIYKCTCSSFIDKGFPHTFFLIESLTEEVFKAEKKAYEKVIRMIAHEVNNTTAGLTSTLDTLTHTLQNEDINSVLQVTIERCYSMNRFINNFADVVRIPEPIFRETNLNELVISCKRFMENICRNKNIQINLNLCEIPPIVVIDGILFEQVLVNIIKNSTEAIGEEGGDIFICTEADPPCLEIADNGKGIDRDTEKKLFTPFFSAKPNGQGLGLIFIREVLQKHGCTFSLRTYSDGLTRFKICFHPKNK
jgi:nitrogen fixation/metabolism regulation signal transduction histidine kinase